MSVQLSLPLPVSLQDWGLWYDEDPTEWGVYRVLADVDPDGRVVRQWREKVCTWDEWEQATGWRGAP